MKRLRHVDVIMTLTSSGVVIRGLPGLFVVFRVCYFYCQTVENMYADDKLIVHYTQNYVAPQQHVQQLQDVQTLYFCYLLVAWRAT